MGEMADDALEHILCDDHEDCWGPTLAPCTWPPAPAEPATANDIIVQFAKFKVEIPEEA